MKMNSHHFKKYIKLIGLFIFVYILFKVDIIQIIKSLSGVDLKKFLLALLLLCVFHFLKAIRWNILLKHKGLKIRLMDCYLTYVIGLYWGLITPGRLGDFIKAYYVKSHGYKLSDGFFVAIIDRVLDLIIFFFFAAIGFIQILKLQHLSSTINYWYALGLLLLFLFVIICVKKKEFIYRKISQLKLFEKIKKEMASFKEYVKIVSSFRSLSFLIGFTILSWFVYLMVVQLLLSSFKVHIPFVQTMVCFFISTLITFLPVTYAGLGTRDAALIFLFKSYGYQSEWAILFSFSILLIYVWTGIIGFIASLIKTIPKTQKTDPL